MSLDSIVDDVRELKDIFRILKDQDACLEIYKSCLEVDIFLDAVSKLDIPFVEFYELLVTIMLPENSHLKGGQLNQARSPGRLGLVRRQGQTGSGAGGGGESAHTAIDIPAEADAARENGYRCTNTQLFCIVFGLILVFFVFLNMYSCHVDPETFKVFKKLGGFEGVAKLLRESRGPPPEKRIVAFNKAYCEGESESCTLSREMRKSVLDYESCLVYREPKAVFQSGIELFHTWQYIFYWCSLVISVPVIRYCITCFNSFLPQQSLPLQGAAQAAALQGAAALQRDPQAAAVQGAPQAAALQGAAQAAALQNAPPAVAAVQRRSLPALALPISDQFLRRSPQRALIVVRMPPTPPRVSSAAVAAAAAAAAPPAGLVGPPPVLVRRSRFKGGGILNFGISGKTQCYALSWLYSVLVLSLLIMTVLYSKSYVIKNIKEAVIPYLASFLDKSGQLLVDLASENTEGVGWYYVFKRIMFEFSLESIKIFGADLLSATNQQLHNRILGYSGFSILFAKVIDSVQKFVFDIPSKFEKFRQLIEDLLCEENKKPTIKVDKINKELIRETVQHVISQLESLKTTKKEVEKIKPSEVESIVENTRDKVQDKIGKLVKKTFVDGKSPSKSSSKQRSMSRKRNSRKLKSKSRSRRLRK